MAQEIRKYNHEASIALHEAWMALSKAQLAYHGSTTSDYKQWSAIAKIQKRVDALSSAELGLLLKESAELRKSIAL